jgi:Amt family ammonium transporter
MVGGICALIGAAMLGARIGKFDRDSGGKVTKVHAIPGSNLANGALGCFILWFGWYGFNGAAATDIPTLGSVLLTTTVAPAVASVTAMIFTWWKYGKPDVSMCLNASLAGLVAITAPCDVVDCAGAAIIGLVAGFLIIFGIWLLDYVLHIDDPVGAVGVHMMNGIWGTIAVGLFATETTPGFAVAGIRKGLFYGGGVSQLGKQLGGMSIIILWTIVTITIVFFILKKTIGLRVTAEEEIVGLDKFEHGLESAFSGFSMAYTAEEVKSAAAAGVFLTDVSPSEASVHVVGSVPDGDTKLTKIVIVTRLTKFDALKTAMNAIGVTGMTVVNVMGCGLQKGASEYYRGVPVEMTLLPKVKVEIVVSKVPVRSVIEAAKTALYTGHPGDGKIFIYEVDNVVKVRTGEEGYAALQYDE